ncbi:NAD(P)-binding protein [Litorivicinus lipolyticus]|uniref:NAD(P)-binding protein n=1 Tax=Litorivicinus lipolyticus TaxID=418701 RepID=A0A5Q2QDM0_9GAMM|nr:NADH:flavin oxidoreductase [Litorivicinus lipolyticus]QGG80432.1 NAD(P)-binding protein [Litorivicinus lipolyticus]
MKYENLFTPLQINQVTVRNRIMSTAHAEVYAENNLTTERYVNYYEEKAKGGVGLAICGGSSPVSRDQPQQWWSAVDLTHDRCIEPLGNLAEAMHRHGAKIMIQATHMGRRNAYWGGDWPHLVSPSGIREPVHRGTAKIIEPHEIQRIIDDFGRAAIRVRDAGLDGIEISCAHQHLIDQFWSPRTNKRTDQWGGSLENRMRFGMEVFAKIREAVGADFAVGMRMCADEFHPDGLSHDDFKEIAQAMDQSGMVDFISVVGSGADTHNTLANCMPPMALPPEPFLDLAASIKSVVKVPVMHAQGIRDPNQAERALSQGMVDLVGMTRGMIADPHMINKIRDGKETQIRQCVGANYCIDRQYLGQDVLCVQNAATSRERFMPHQIERTDGPLRKIVVVGAGPAGMEASRVARERGHEVVLFEAAGAVGGQINLAAKAPQRDQMAGIVRWFDMELQRLGVDVRLNTWADEAAILAEQPDIVVLATGGSAGIDENPEWGAAEGLAVSSWDILSGKVAPKDNVLVYDVMGQHAGTGTADFISNKGSRVEIVTPEPKVADDVGGTTFPIFYRRTYGQGIMMTPNYWLTRAYAEGDKVIAVLMNEYTEEHEEREVDQLVIENGIVPNDGLYWTLRERSSNGGITDMDQLYDHIPQSALTSIPAGQFALFRVGDCISMHNIHGAIYDALRIAKDF